MRQFHVERLFELGSYKNIKFSAGIEVSDEDLREGTDIFRQLVDEIYQAYFEHGKRLADTEAGKNMTDKERIFFA